MIRLVILVIITVVLSHIGLHFSGWGGAITGTILGIGVIVLGGRV